MSRYVSVNTCVEVEVNLERISTDDLLEELERRGESFSESSDEDLQDQLLKIYHLRRQGKSFEYELDSYLSGVLGVVV